MMPRAFIGAVIGIQQLHPFPLPTSRPNLPTHLPILPTHLPTLPTDRPTFRPIETPFQSTGPPSRTHHPIPAARRPSLPPNDPAPSPCRSCRGDIGTSAYSRGMSCTGDHVLSHFCIRNAACTIRSRCRLSEEGVFL